MKSEILYWCKEQEEYLNKNKDHGHYRNKGNAKPNYITGVKNRSGMAPTVELLDAERVLQRLRGVRGQNDATETGRRATPQRIVDIVRHRTLK